MYTRTINHNWESLRNLNIEESSNLYKRKIGIVFLKIEIQGTQNHDQDNYLL